MAAKYVLDSCALLAYVYQEIGDDVVKLVLEQADVGHIQVYMNKLNLLEVYYDIRRSEGFKQAEKLYNMVQKSPVNIIDGISDPVFREAARLKSQYRMSLADSIALGETSVLEASILTSDHHEFDLVEQSEAIKFAWIR